MIEFTEKVRRGGFWSQRDGVMLVPTPACWHIVSVAEPIWIRNGAEGGCLVVTAFFNGVHSRFSEHKQGNGVDIRTRNLPGGYLGDAAQACAEELFDSLGSGYTVILEEDHVHAHHEPGGGKLILP